MKQKRSKVGMTFAIVVEIICAAALFALFAAMLGLDHIHDLWDFLTGNVNALVTVGCSVVILSVIMYLYFAIESPQIASSPKKIFEIYLLLALACFLDYVIELYVSPIASPIAFFALMAAMIMRKRDAVFLNAIYALAIFVFSFFLNGAALTEGGVGELDAVADLLCVLCTGTIAVFVIRKMRTRMASVAAAFILMIPTLAIDLSILVPAMEEITAGAVWTLVLFAVLACVFSTLLFLFFLPGFEAVFSELTPFRLRELTSDSAPMMKRLKTEAPGTYNHSVVVGQLATACAHAVGENVELTRAVAYYHDIGKLEAPEMFAENQMQGVNKHDDLPPDVSASIIRAHAEDGAMLAKKRHLPEIFSDVCLEHHGTMPIRYFYAKALRLSDGDVDVAAYSYRGPTPSTKIAALVMISDASEAAVRSLKDRSPENVEKMVRSIIEERMNMEQFDNCDITMKDLTLITKTIVVELSGVYHPRIEYPKVVASRSKQNSTRQGQ